MPGTFPKHSLIGKSVCLTVFVLYIYVCFEWVFFATKPSFLDSYSFIERILSLLGTPLIFVPILLFAFLLTVVVFFIKPDWFNRRRLHILVLVPAGITTVLTALLIDNFTNTVLQTGISRTKEHQPYIWLLAITLIFYGWGRSFTKDLGKTKPPFWKGALLLIGLSVISFAVSVLFNDPPVTESYTRNSSKSLPNILLFASDGVEADHLRVYGADRQTTPYLDSLLPQSLVFHNAISNAGRTTGAVTALLTGKYPTTTKVIFPPHILRGRHSIQHLPGILKNLGYTNIQESIRYYADAADLNLVNGFDMANGRALSEPSGLLSDSLRYKLLPTFVLAQTLWERVKDRALHLIGYRKMANAFDEVNPKKIAKVYGLGDQTRIDRLIEFIDQTEGPFFAHVHLIDSHCCYYYPKRKFFSASEAFQNDDNVDDFYDDIILDSDKHFARVVEWLKANGQYDNTFIIYYSDHARQWKTDESVPLILKLPENEYVGERSGSYQLIDIAPTLIEYLGFEKISWMEGRSLIADDQNIERDIFTIDSVLRKSMKTASENLSALVGGGPPLYGVKTVNLINCDQNFNLNLVDDNIKQSPLKTSAASCESTLSEPMAKQKIKQHLYERGFILPRKED